MEEFQASHPDGVPVDPQRVVNPQGYCLFCHRQFDTAAERYKHQQWEHVISQEEVSGAHWGMLMEDGEPCHLGIDYKNYEAFMSPDHACDIFYNTEHDMIDETTTSEDEAADYVSNNGGEVLLGCIKAPSAGPPVSQMVTPPHGQDEERTELHQLPERDPGQDPARRDS